MNPVPASINAPAAPQVNLLPPEIEAKRSQGRARIIILFGLIAFVLVLGAAWFLAYSARVEAEQDLALEQERRPTLVTELATYDYVRDVQAEAENSANARAWAGATDIDWATHMTALLAAVPEDVQLTGIQMVQTTPYGGATAAGTDFASLDMGSITFIGRALEPGLTTDLVVAFDGLPGFSGTWVDSKEIQANEDTDTGYWEYTGSTRITVTALSGRIETEQTEVPPEVLAAVEQSTSGNQPAAAEDGAVAPEEN